MTSKKWCMLELVRQLCGNDAIWIWSTGRLWSDYQIEMSDGQFWGEICWGLKSDDCQFWGESWGV